MLQKIYNRKFKPIRYNAVHVQEFRIHRQQNCKNKKQKRFPLTLLLIIYSTACAFNSWLESENKECYLNCSISINTGAVSNTAVLFSHD